MQPLVSVIMPAYKTETFIKKSIESVQSQSFTEWELIVIDDGSPDSLLEIVAKMMAIDQRIKLFSQKNSGVSVARNKGLSLAKGKYVAFLDSDDIWESSFLKKMIDKVNKSSSSFCYCGYIRDLPDGKKRSFGPPYLSGNLLRSIIFSKQPIWICGVLVERKILKDYHIEFTPGCRIAEDTEFIMKIVTVTLAEVVPEELACYIYRPNSATHSVWNSNHIDVLGVMERVYDFVSRYKVNLDSEEILEEIRRRKNTHLYRVLWHLISANHMEEAKTVLQKYSTAEYYEGRKKTHTLKLRLLKNGNSIIWKGIYYFEKIRSLLSMK